MIQMSKLDIASRKRGSAAWLGASLRSIRGKQGTPRQYPKNDDRLGFGRVDSNHEGD
jgi:hypothetical protein